MNLNNILNSQNMIPDHFCQQLSKFVFSVCTIKLQEFLCKAIFICNFYSFRTECFRPNEWPEALDEVGE